MTATLRGVSVTGRNGQIDKDGKIEYGAVYKVYCDDKRDGPIKANSAFGVPRIGDPFNVGNDFDATCRVINKNIDQGDSPYEWLISITWSNDLEKKPDEKKRNPLEDPPEISYGFQNRRVIVPGRFNDPIGPPNSRDFDRGIFAPNGELFDPQPEVDLAEPVLTVTRNQQSIDAQAFMALANGVNSDFFEGAEPRQLKMNAPQAQRKYDEEIGFYWTVTYGMAFRWETWDIQILNQGYYYWSGGKPTNVWGTTDVPLVKRILTGEPRLIALSTNGDINNTANPTFTRLRVFREINFSALKII